MSTRIRRTVLTGAAVLALGIGATASPSQARGGDATLTRGDFNAFAAGADLDIDGRAWMLRTDRGTTRVVILLSGLEPGVTYGSHVHSAPCNLNEAGGHYMLNPGGEANPPNEIWPGPITANKRGWALGGTRANFIAGPEAVSVVVHQPGDTPNKIACADLS